MILPILNTFVPLLTWMNGMHFLTLFCKQKTHFMTKNMRLFNKFLKQYGIYREFYQELRLFQPCVSKLKDEEIKFPDEGSSESYIFRYLDWNHTRRGPHFWSLMNDAWEQFREDNL